MTMRAADQENSVEAQREKGMKRRVLQMVSTGLVCVLFSGVSCATQAVSEKAAPGGEDGTRAEQAMQKSPGAPAQPVSEPELRRVPVNYSVYRYMPETPLSPGTETLLAEISQEVAGKVYYELKEEGGKHLTARVAVVNTVPLSDFKRDTEFGRIMGEYLLTDLANRGLHLTELRMGKEINILPQTGEFILSRNIAELANRAPELDYVVVSTFSNTRKTLIVQGRLVRLKDGQVTSSWRHSLPLNRELLGLFYMPEASPRIAVKGLGQ